MTEEWIEEFNQYQEEVEYRKSLRPKCEKYDSGEHTMISYESTRTKECDRCGYVENIYSPVDPPRK